MAKVKTPTNPREVIIGWMKPEVDDDGYATGKEVYAQELFKEVDGHEVLDNGVLVVTFGDQNMVFAPGIWYFNRTFENGVPTED